jgi:hypothetical protein
LAYPGTLAAFADTLARFPATTGLAFATPAGRGRPKIALTAETIWPDVWRDGAPAGLILFPQIEGQGEHRLEKLAPAEALRRLLPHAVEQWDRPMIPAHLAALRRLVEKAPAYTLQLGPNVEQLPALLSQVLAEARRGDG